MNTSSVAHHSLRTRVLVPLVAAGAFAVLFGTWRVQSRVEEAFRVPGLERARTLASAAALGATSAHDPDDLQRKVQVLGAEREVESLVVIRERSGEVIASTRSAWVGQSVGSISDEVFVKTLAASRESQVFEASSSDGYFLARDVDAPQGRARMLLHLSAEPATRAATALSYRLALYGAGVLAVLFVLGNTLLRRHVLRPLELLEGGRAGATSDRADAA